MSVLVWCLYLLFQDSDKWSIAPYQIISRVDDKDTINTKYIEKNVVSIVIQISFFLIRIGCKSDLNQQPKKQTNNHLYIRVVIDWSICFSCLSIGKIKKFLNW